MIKGIGFAFSGILQSIKTEANFKIYLYAIIFVIAMGLFFHLSLFEWLWVLLATCLVIAAELMNTAMESLANIVSPDFHPLIKKAKDAAAGSVLIMAFFALITAIFIFAPKIINLIYTR